MADLEIGVVYKKSGKLFLAVDEATLVSCKDGKATVIRPNTKYDVVRSISVEKLCDGWGITLDLFDHLMKDYLGPPEVKVKTRPRGTRRKKDDDDAFWERHRTGRIARPRL